MPLEKQIDKSKINFPKDFIETYIQVLRDVPRDEYVRLFNGGVILTELYSLEIPSL